ncbi:Glycosyltransferases involved in cell wall biogenesis [Paenibacillus uliginis N3/975]|uniref:Glycosyltransferases involved in cell wall biogenesis n=1 Tax=Paenibacillus uliginis N3/975 TaxID=1313296 RepID=A0A1X7GCG6_9BACL|nr:glycosyltransferase [Paenibacillus uliginis]SMF67658.1 Glycosyltransferases involved in cell wall biogenesis [Paenibacillus uliginis N3/975]
MINDNLLEQRINQALVKIDDQVNTGLVDEAYNSYIELIEELERENSNSHYLLARVYLSFAYFLFRVSEFDSFFMMLIKAQENGYSREEIEKVLYEAFIEPNLNEFQDNYEANIEYLNKNSYLYIENSLPFQELSFWLLPTGVQNEYYLYDKEQQLIKEKISLYQYQQIPSVTISDAFSDFLVLEEWDWNNIVAITNATRKLNKKSYIIINQIDKFLSCLQGSLLDDISNIMIFDNLYKLKEYLLTTNSILPYNIIDLTEDKSDVSKNVLSDIHNTRISKEHRNGNRILLSICIPSYNRGHKAYENIIQLLQFHYNEEIEIILSNNGTQNETKAYYEKISEIEDARLTYFAFEENQGYALNCCKVCELAKGEFILLLSDEDQIDSKVLSIIMDSLNKSKETLSIFRASTSSQSKQSNKIASMGKEAMLQFMLSSNYMSGIIYSNKLLQKANGIQYIKVNISNSACFWYPHMVWEMLLCQYGHVQSTELVLIHEGLAEKTDCDEVEIEKLIIPYYASIEGRLEQHEDFAVFFRDLEIYKEDIDLRRKMYLQLCSKTCILVAISIQAFYSKTNLDLRELNEKAYQFCSNEQFYKTNVSSDRLHYQKDLKLIEEGFSFINAKLQ